MIEDPWIVFVPSLAACSDPGIEMKPTSTAAAEGSKRRAVANRGRIYPERLLAERRSFICYCAG